MPDVAERSETPVVVDGLTRRFGDFVAVDSVSFEVHEGEIFGFLGPNGAGKTTTIKMLTGLLRPSSGRGWVAGRDIQGDRTPIKKRIGYMSQRFSLYPDLTVGENIRLFAGLYGVRGDRFAARLRWIMELAGGEVRESSMTASLPLGWKQRLALGCALVHEPPILFLDEPTSGVDPVARRRFWDVIDRLAGAGTTVFVSTHYMEEAEYCTRLALMNRGRLVALDSPERLRARFESPILEVLTDDAPRAVEALAGAPDVLDASMYGRALHVVVDDEQRGTDSLTRRLQEAGRTVERVRRVPATLEDVFVSLVQR